MMGRLMTMICVMASAACGGGSSRDRDECDTDCSRGAKRCSNDVIEICVVGYDGCTHWQAETDCSETLATCDASSGTAECVISCNDTCTSLGATRCSGTLVQQCQQGMDNCMSWVDGQDCASTGQICDDSFDPVQCECDDQCERADDYCSANTAWHCVESNFGCWSWETTDCVTETCYVGDEGSTCGTECDAHSREQCGVDAACEPQVDAGGLQAWICIDLLTGVPSVAAFGECDSNASDGLDNQCAEGAMCQKEVITDVVGQCRPYCDASGTSQEPGATCPDALACNAWADDVGLCAWP